jgi:enoyl-CoA hydratase/carnithine racemase
MATPGSTVEQELVRYQLVGHVAVVTLNRPTRLNAVSGSLAEAVGQALEQAAAHDQVRVVVVTGAGRAFCAGADLVELSEGRSVHPTEHPEWGFAGIAQHWIDKPLVAAVNGLARGGGTEIVLAADIAIADEAATFGLPEASRGLLAAAGGVIRLQRQVPVKVALEMVLTGAPIHAHRAAELGLVNRVAPAGKALEVAMDMAEQIAQAAPLAVRWSKRVLHQTAGAPSTWDPEWSDADPWAVNAAAMDVVFGSADAREGALAFAEKRAPQWTGE